MDPSGGTALWSIAMWWAGLAVAPELTPNAVERAYSLEYEAVASCPDVAALARAIEARTPGAQQQPVDRAAVQLRVELREDGTGTLWLHLPDGSSRREFPKAACADTVTTIAVIASMVLEADASERSATAETVLERIEPTPAPPEGVTPAPQQKPPATPPAATPSTPPAAARSDVRGGTAATRLRVAVSAGALLESAVAKGAAVGASAGLAGWLEPARTGYWAPRVQAEVLTTLPATVQAQAGDVELQLKAARVQLCPLRLTLGHSLQLIPCLTGDAGSLRAQGSGSTLNPKTKRMLWLALGGSARAQLALGRVLSLDSWLGLRGLAGGADTFVFNPGVLAYQVPTWSLGAGLGVSATLP